MDRNAVPRIEQASESDVHATSGGLTGMPVAFDAFLRDLLGPLLPKRWQRNVFALGLLVLALGVWLHIQYGKSTPYLAVIGVGVIIAFVPFAFRMLLRLYYKLFLFGKEAMYRIVGPSSNGPVLYVSAAVTTQDEPFYIFAQQTGDGIDQDAIPYSIVVLRYSHKFLTVAKTLIENGWQLRLLFLEGAEWSTVLGIVCVGDSIYIYNLRPSFGNRGANKSAFLHYYDLETGGEFEANRWYSDEPSISDGIITYKPSFAGFPSGLRRHAELQLTRAGFRGMQDTVFDREMRYWLTLYEKPLRKKGGVTLKLRWMKGTLSTLSGTRVRLAGDEFEIAGFRSGGVVRLQDGAWALVYVFHSWTSISAGKSALTITVAPESSYTYDPSTNVLQKV